MICTVCGTELRYPETRRTERRRPTTGPGSSGHALLASLSAVNQLQQDLNAPELAQFARELAMHEIFHSGWERIPDVVLDPQAGAMASSRPTSNEYLQNLSKFRLSQNSFLFFKASLCIPAFVAADAGSVAAGTAERNSMSTTMEAIPAEFAATDPNLSLDAASSCLVVVAEPRTGRGGQLPFDTLQQVQRMRQRSLSVVLYMERGDNVSFIQKARLAEAAGAKALVVGNNVGSPWPYVMKDSSPSHGTEVAAVQIPVVMVRQADGQAIVRASKERRESVLHGASLSMTRMNDHDCIICQEVYNEGDVAVRIPACGHVFHEACVMMWLRRSNTCPFCRRELPTEDPEYEHERRRQQRTHAGTEGFNTAAQYEEYYG